MSDMAKLEEGVVTRQAEDLMAEAGQPAEFGTRSPPGIGLGSPQPRGGDVTAWHLQQVQSRCILLEARLSSFAGRHATDAEQVAELTDEFAKVRIREQQTASK